MAATVRAGATLPARARSCCDPPRGEAALRATRPSRFESGRSYEVQAVLYDLHPLRGSSRDDDDCLRVVLEEPADVDHADNDLLVAIGAIRRSEGSTYVDTGRIPLPSILWHVDGRPLEAVNEDTTGLAIFE